MEKIASFTVDHERLLPGVYVSRRDSVANGCVTTFDLRLTAPNREQVLSTGVCHAIEHLGATYLRNDPVWGSKTVYFGPMGCRTGFYMLLEGELEPLDVAPVLRELFAFIAMYEGEIPGADPVSCGNYSDMDLQGARTAALRYLRQTLSDLGAHNTEYPA